MVNVMCQHLTTGMEVVEITPVDAVDEIQVINVAKKEMATMILTNVYRRVQMGWNSGTIHMSDMMDHVTIKSRS